MQININTAFLFAAISCTPLGAMAVGCFSGGQAGDCSSFISTFCQSSETQNLVSGETRSSCFNLGGIECNFAIKNNNGGTASADIGNCISVNTATNNGCHSHGGIASSENCLFTLDPNTGSC